MSARLHLEYHYDAEIETVYALITDPDFVTRKYVALGGTDVAVDSSAEDDGGCEVVTKRTVTVDLPGFAKRVMTPSNTTVQIETWAAADGLGNRVCTYSVEVQGIPSRITGTVTLSADAGGTKQEIRAEVKVSIPLIGGKLEKFGVDTGTKDIDAQAAFTVAELAR
jgi:uncharacterized protein YndB with AHSA1/START domain